MSTDNKYGISKEDIRKAALGDFDDFKPENEIPAAGQAGVQANEADFSDNDITIPVEDIPAQQTVKSEIFCTMCGRKLPATAKFCTGCGNQISAPVADIQQDGYNDIYSSDIQQPVYDDVYSGNPDYAQPPVTDDYIQDDTMYGQGYQYQDQYNNQQAYQQQAAYAQGGPYQQTVYVQQQYNPVARPLKTNRNGIVALLLSFLTLGIYGLIYNAGIADDVNTVCTRFDGKKTMNFWLMTFIISPITLGIGSIVWIHNLCARIGRNLTDRGISYSFGAGTFWGWCILGSLIFVGPFIYIHKLSTAMNLINEDYNMKG